MKPIFLSLGEVVEIHRNQICLYGGDPGIRDLNLLQSAVATPQATFGGDFLHGSLCEMAAAYLFHIVQTHAFVDGNKRTGAAAAYVFLALNGLELTAEEAAFEKLVRNVAEGKTDKATAADFFRFNTKP